MYTLEERDGRLYAKQTMIDLDEPRKITNWYALTITKDELALYVPDLSKKLGCVLNPTLNPATVWKDDQGWTYHITSGISGERKAVFTETIPITEPEQHGRRYTLQWHQGAWHKRINKRLVRLN